MVGLSTGSSKEKGFYCIISPCNIYFGRFKIVSHLHTITWYSSVYELYLLFYLRALFTFLFTSSIYSSIYEFFYLDARTICPKKFFESNLKPCLAWSHARQIMESKLNYHTTRQFYSQGRRPKQVVDEDKVQSLIHQFHNISHVLLRQSGKSNH